MSFLPPLVKAGRAGESPEAENAETQRISYFPPTSGWQATSGRASPGRAAPRKSAGQELTIKVLEDMSELLDAYRLRYDVYESLNYLQQKNFSRLEIDEYDWYAIPCGAFSAQTGELLGTVRLITDRLQERYVYKIQRILHECADDQLTELASKPRSRPIPSINSPLVEEMLSKFNVEQRNVYEVSRLIIHPDYRGLGVSRALVEFDIACARQHGSPVLISSCIPQHVPINARYGFVKLPGTAICMSDIVGQMANTIVCDTRVLPEPTAARVAEIHRGLSEGAKACTLDLSDDPLGVYRFSESEAPREGIAALGA